jgi:hypothetical protein
LQGDNKSLISQSTVHHQRIMYARSAVPLECVPSHLRAQPGLTHAALDPGLPRESQATRTPSATPRLCLQDLPVGETVRHFMMKSTDPRQSEHLIRDCPNKEAADAARRGGGPRPPPPGYVCRACGMQDAHYIRECPVVAEREGERAKRKELGPAECTSCIGDCEHRSSPQAGFA